MTDDRLNKFLAAVRSQRWTDVPRVWNAELREALGDSLVRVGWGGVLELTEAGKAKLNLK